MSYNINVTPIASTEIFPTDSVAKSIKTINNNLLGEGKNNYFTFKIDGIPESSVLFGLHLLTLDNSSDKNIEHCLNEYDAPDIDLLSSIILNYYFEQCKNIHGFGRTMSFVCRGFDIYNKYKDSLVGFARDAIKQERPNASDEYIEQNAPRFVHEQLRMFVSMIMPTTLDWTIDINTLAMLYRTAWTPEMREVISETTNAVMQKHPETKNLFDKSLQSTQNWHPEFFIPRQSNLFVMTEPDLSVCNTQTELSKSYINTNPDQIDTMSFNPYSMKNSMN